MNDMHGVAMNRDELIHGLAQAIAGDSALLVDGWEHLVLVSQIEDGTPDLTGFCYTGDGRAVPVSPEDFAIFDVIEALREAMAEVDDDRPWLAALFRVDRETGKVTAEFEYDKPERWAVTPDNAKARAQEFAPA
jgi:hypothetical protein